MQRWNVPAALQARMQEAARELRKMPTCTESLLWRQIRQNALEGRKFRRQQVIGPFVVDFYCSTERLVVEVDGGVHAGQVEKDRARQQCLEELGLRFVRLPAEQVEHDMPAALATIRQSLTSSPVVLPSPLVGEGSGVGGDAAAHQEPA